jgi:hypothetical protein
MLIMTFCDLTGHEEFDVYLHSGLLACSVAYCQTVSVRGDVDEL